MVISKNDIIGALVAQNYRFAQIFKERKIDFCCHGNKSIAVACQETGIDEKELIETLETTLSTPQNEIPDYNNWPLDLLADYIEKTHHRYVETQSQILKGYLEKIYQVHGKRHPELLEIKKLFNKTAEAMAVHMKKEELILFPFIRKLVHAKQKGENLKTPPFKTIESPIKMMQEDHNSEGERFQKIETLSNYYTPPKDACNTYKITFSLLNEFAEDLHKHIHLENNILFPKAIQLEKETPIIN